MTHTCEAAPDAGADGGRADGGPHDGGTRDSGVHDAGDATLEDATPLGGFVEGGGLSCDLGRPSREPPLALAALLGVGIALGTRRRRR
jgi:MYXO-CTERM domain-containing protein